MNKSEYRHITEKKADEVIRLLRKGMHMKTIAGITGVSASAVLRWSTRLLS